jgi:hypothetical protein
MRPLAILARRLLLATAAALPAMAAAQPADWSLRLPVAEPVAFRGVVSMDAAGSKSGSMLYPAPSAAGFLAALITHGLLVESMKSSEKQALQATADKVLAPYLPLLEGFRHQELMSRALARSGGAGDKRLVAPNEPAGGRWLVESGPLFSMTQDRRALVLDNAVAIWRPGESGKPAYQAVIRVVSQARPETEAEQGWSERNGEPIKEEATSLLAHSLDLALKEAARSTPADETPFKTVRYPEGQHEKIERAQLVSRACHRQVVRTLRGWLLSVPAGEPAESCEPALANWR